MMSELTRKLDEVRRLSELYGLYHACNEDWRRRKVHVDLDKFLMENREIAIICMERVLDDEIQRLIAAAKPTKISRLKRLLTERRFYYEKFKSRRAGNRERTGSSAAGDSDSGSASPHPGTDGHLHEPGL